MQPTNNKQRIAATLALIIIVVGLSALAPAGKDTFYQKEKAIAADTTPSRKKMKEKMEYKVGDLDRAIKELDRIDMADINREVVLALKEVDWKKIKDEVDLALHESLKDIDIIEKKEMKDLQLNLDKSLSGARVGIEKAKQELAMLKEFTESLEKEGLISKKKGYKIEIKNDELYLNGTKQSKEVTDRYRKYFKDKDYSIVRDGESISSI